jgi:transposase
VSICLAASSAHGLIYYDVNSSTFDRETFAGFIDSLAEEVAVGQIPNPYFILDNCAIHNLDEVMEGCVMFGSEFNFLPLYFPMLTPRRDALMT